MIPRKIIKEQEPARETCCWPRTLWALGAERWNGEMGNQSRQAMGILRLASAKLEFPALLALGKPAEAGGTDSLPLEKPLLKQLWRD